MHRRHRDHLRGVVGDLPVGRRHRLAHSRHSDPHLRSRDRTGRSRITRASSYISRAVDSLGATTDQKGYHGHCHQNSLHSGTWSIQPGI